MFNTGIKGFVIITCVLAVVTYGIVMTLLSASARKVFSQFGQKVWHWVKEVMKWFPRRFKRKNPVTDEEKTEWRKLGHDQDIASDENECCGNLVVYEALSRGSSTATCLLGQSPIAPSSLFNSSHTMETKRNTSNANFPYTQVCRRSMHANTRHNNHH